VLSRFVRYGIGAVVSAAAIVITLQRVDLGEVARAMAATSLAPVLLALSMVIAEVALRAARWRLLLLPIRRLPYLTAASYLCIGYLANTILPARLGDVTRAYLAGTAFGVRRTTTLGTILVERVGDGVLMLGVVLVLGSILPHSGNLLVAAVTLAVIGTAAVGLLVLSVAGVRRSRLAGTPMWEAAERVLVRLWAGMIALRQPAGLLALLATTVGAFAIAVAVFVTISSSLGLALSLPQGVLVTAGLALSLAIPAGPGSVGTYELVGLTILTGLGMPADRALAAIVLHHAVVAIPPALLGMVAMWVLHIRVGTLSSGSPGPLATDDQAASHRPVVE
jgi:glycosyltransferase 2 family protein